MIVYSYKYSQRHKVLICLISGVKCHRITKILVRAPAACISPEDVLYATKLINLEVEEEFIIYCFHLSKESQQLLDVIDAIFLRVKKLPAYFNNTKGCTLFSSMFFLKLF